MKGINSLWIGDRLGEVHAACLRSFVRRGYEVTLHCFDRPVDAPEGVEFFDASRLMKADEIVRHKTGSLSLAADIYRYRLLREGMGTYVDADVYCLRPLPETEYLIGREADQRLSNAILRIPPESKLLRDILEASENPYYIPPWIKRQKQFSARVRKFIGAPVHVSEQQWGVIGPRLITHLVMGSSLQDVVQPIDVLFPLHFDQISLLFARGCRLSDITSSRSCTIHLCNSSLVGREILPDTPLHEIVSS